MNDLATLQRELERNTAAQQRVEHAIRLQTRALMMAQPQIWDVKLLLPRYSMSYEHFKAWVELKLGYRFRDKRTACLTLDQVLELDETLTRRQSPESEAAAQRSGRGKIAAALEAAIGGPA